LCQLNFSHKMSGVVLMSVAGRELCLLLIAIRTIIWFSY